MCLNCLTSIAVFILSATYPFSEDVEIFARMRQFWKDCGFSGHPNDPNVS